jgi:hypothetical protein
MIVYQAVYVSRHFQFEACAGTKEEARAALILGLRRHAHEYAIDEDWWMEEGVPIDELLQVYEFELGVTYRDHQALRAH